MASLYSPELAESSNSIHFLVGSDQSIRYINHDNTAVNIFTEDPLIDYCIEHGLPDGSTERIYTEDTRVAFILSHFGYKTISQQYAPEEHVVGYEVATFRDEPELEWDVVDYDGKTSLVLKHFFAHPNAGEDSQEDSPEIPILPANDIAITIELGDQELELRHDNTEVIIFDKQSDHREFSHIRIRVGTTEEGQSVSTLVFNDRRLMRILRRKRYPTRILPQIMDPKLITYISQVVIDELDEDQDKRRFELTIEGDDADEDSALQ